LILLCGCGGSTSTSGNSQTSSLRVVDGNGMMPSVNVLVDGGSVVNNVTFLTKTDYFSVPAGTHQVTLNGWLDPPNVSGPENFPAGQKSTLIFEGCGIFGRSVFQLITDDVTPPAAGNFKLRIVYGAIQTPAADVYVLPLGAPISGTPTIGSMAMASVNSTSPYFSFPAGTYHIAFTQIGNTTLEFDSGPINFSSGQNRTYYLFQEGGQTATPGVFFCDAVFKPMLIADLN
jgi:hypothetical protein